MIGDQVFEASFTNESGDWILEFEDSEKIYKALRVSEDMDVTYQDMENKERSLEFSTAGFDAVTKGWEPLCVTPSS